MKYYNSYKRQISVGKQSENTFKETMKKNKIPVKKATRTENKNLHIDLYIDLSGCLDGVDVKSIGKFGYTVEISNNWGTEGSIFGKAKYMAYVGSNKIYLVLREKLLDFVRKELKDDVVHQSDEFYYINDPYYRLYTRNTRYGWKDEWVVCKTVDIMNLIEREFIYEQQ